MLQFVIRQTAVVNYALAAAMLGSLGSFSAKSVFADDWPQWLGPQRDAEWRESEIIDSFPPAGLPLRWKTAIGAGYSGPAVADGRVFVLDRVDTSIALHEGKHLHKDTPPDNSNFVRRLLPGKERIVCLDETNGNVLWTHKYDCPYTMVATYATGPRVTPTIDNGLIYSLGAEGNLICLQAEGGKVVWQRDFQQDYGVETPEWGFSSHPLVDGNRLICMVGGQGATVVAFDKKTGKEIWRALNASVPGYAPPMIYQLGGKRQLVVWDGDALSGLSPQSGKVYWTVPVKPTFGMSIGAPQADGNSLFIMSYNRLSFLVQVAVNGESAKLVWHGDSRRGIGGVMNTPVLNDGFIYGCGHDGKYLCARLDNGEQQWSTFQPSTGNRPAQWANVFTVRHQDRYFLANDLGDLIIARLSPDRYEEVSRTHLIDPTHDIGQRTVVWSHPAFANQSIYVRNDQEICCYSLAVKKDDE